MKSKHDGNDYLIELFENKKLNINELINRIRKDDGIRFRGDLHDVKKLAYNQERQSFIDWLKEILDSDNILELMKEIRVKIKELEKK